MHYPLICSKAVFVLITSLCLVLASGFVKAHEITPSIIEIASTTDSTHYTLKIDANLEALIVGLTGEHQNTDDLPVATEYNNLRMTPAKQLTEQAGTFVQKLADQLEFRNTEGKPIPFRIEKTTLDINENSDLNLARDSFVTYLLISDQPIKGLSFSWPESYGDSVFRVFQNSEPLGALWVKGGERSNAIEFNAPAQTQNLVDYVLIGFEHILPLGVDHILFVIGLYLLSQRLGALLWQVTAFTVAHTITLALATLGVISLPASVVEPLIAASIAYVAIENLFSHHVTKFRIGLVFLFGLLHGLGFAGVLSEIGLNPSAFISSLIAFNIGVEFGQLAVITSMYLLFGWWLGKTKYWENGFRKPVSILIALLGSYWFIERILSA